MNKRWLVDAGPLVALFARDDNAHREVVSFFARHRATLLTTWPVLTEAWHLLPFQKARLDLMRWVAGGGIEMHELQDPVAPALMPLLEKYADLPMDLADASLVLLAIDSGVDEVLTLDRKDFSAYRLPGNRRFKLVLDI